MTNTTLTQEVKIQVIPNTDDQQKLIDELFGAAPVQPAQKPVQKVTVEFGPKPILIEVSHSVISRKPIVDEKVVQAYFIENFTFADLFAIDEDLVVNAAIKWNDTYRDGDLEQLQTLSGGYLLNEIEETLPLKFQYEVREAYFEVHFDSICKEMNNDRLVKAG